MKLINIFRKKGNCDRLARVSNEELIDGIYNSDDALFSDLYHCSMDIVIGYIRTKRKYIADDDVSEIYHLVFIAFCENIKSRELNKSNFKVKPTTYMVGIARNILRKEFRDRIKNPLLEYSKVEFEKDLKLARYPGLDNKEESKQMERFKRLDQFYEGLNLLDDRCERIISAFHFEKLSLKEIAEEMGFKSDNVAKSKKSKCILKLKELVKKMQDGKIR